MLKWFSLALVVLLGIHGLIHLMGFVAYWTLGTMSELPYKTAFFGERLEFGAGGTRLYSVLWLVAGIGFVAAAIALLAGWEWGQPLLLAPLLARLLPQSNG